MLDITVVLIFLLTFVICVYVTKVSGLISARTSPPGPWGVPVLGHLPFLGKSVPATYGKWRRKYGDVFKIRLGSVDVVVLNGYDAIKAAAEYENDAFSSRPNFYSLSLLSECNKHADQISFSPFHSRYLHVRKNIASNLRAVTHLKKTPVLEIMSKEVEELCDTLLEKGKDQTRVSVDSEITFTVSTIIFHLIYGEYNDFKREVMERLHANHNFETFTGAGNPLDVMPWLRLIFPRQVREFIDLLVNFMNLDEKHLLGQKEAFDQECLRTVTDYLIDFERRNTYTEEGKIISLCLYHSLKDIFSAGFTTTATTLKWLILYLTAFPKVQENIQREIDQTVGQERRVTLDDRQTLPYTMAAILEIMRLTSIVPFALPHATARDVIFKGFHIAKNTAVIFNLHSINHDEDTWGDPENFRPERLLTHDGQLDDARCRMVVPFSFGRRQCVGQRLAKMELFVLFARLMQRCKFYNPDGDDLDLTPIPALVYKPHLFRVCVEDRRQ